MRVLWAILLGGLALIGTAEARLGETIGQIEKDLGLLKFEEDLRPNEILFAKTQKRDGFDGLYFQFLKKNNRCVTFRYGKMYKNISEVAFSFADARKIIEKSFPGSRPSLVEYQGIKNGKQEEALWRAVWKTQSGGYAAASLQKDREEYSSCPGYTFVILCKDPAYVKIESTIKPNIKQN